MKRLFLLFFLVISLTALYLSFVSCKEGFKRSRPFSLKTMAAKIKQIIQTKIKTRQRVAKK